MPHKFNANRRAKIPKQKQRVTNWAEYNEGLRRRGDLTVWISDEALGMWSAARRTTRGGRPRYSDLAIELCLTLGMVFKQPLRQTQGFMRRIAGILGVEGKRRTGGLSPHCEFQFLAARACSTKNAAVA
jgi:hypothetical protein